MAFESLGDKFQRILKKVKGQAKLTEKNMEDMLREVRIALLEADVNYKIVREFVNEVKEKSIGQKVLTKLSPGETIVKIVHDELEELLGSTDSDLHFEINKPTVFMLVGLQGTGKTTSAAKLANLLKNKMNKKVLLVAGDIYRPAAIDQLKTLGQKLDVTVYEDRSGTLPPKIAKDAYLLAQRGRYDVVIIDTAGRLEIDETLMTELVDITKAVDIKETLLLVDAMSGQNAINVANEFNKTLKLTGLIMSKLDGDSRGGSALSIKKLTGVPIKFAGIGEKIEDLEVFHPDRMADRILGMGDIVSLVEKVQESVDEEATMKVTKKIMSGKFGLDDMLAMMKQIKRMGPLGKLIKMLPGMPKVSEEDLKRGEDAQKKMEVIIQSMTKEERKDPSIIRNSRKVRIANGSGTTNADVNKVINSYEQMKKSVAQMSPMIKKQMNSMSKEDMEKFRNFGK